MQLIHLVAFKVLDEAQLLLQGSQCRLQAAVQRIYGHAAGFGEKGVQGKALQ